MTELDTVETMILSEVNNVLGMGDHDEPVSSETSLVTSGLIDSLGVVRMALFLEREFGVDFTQIFFDQLRFDTIRSMRSLVTEHGDSNK